MLTTSTPIPLQSSALAALPAASSTSSITESRRTVSSSLEFDDSFEDMNATNLDDEMDESKIDTTEVEAIKNFIQRIESLQLGEGQILWDELQRLHKGRQALTSTLTITRIMKYFASTEVEYFHDSKYDTLKTVTSFGKINRAQNKVNLVRDAIVYAFTDEKHMKGVVRTVLKPFKEELLKLDGGSMTGETKKGGENSMANRGILLLLLIIIILFLLLLSSNIL